MQFIDLKAQQQRIRTSIDARIKAVLDHGIYIMGPEIKELEEKLCDFCGAKHCITCASGTDALLMPLMAWGIGEGDAVFMPPFTFFATSEMPYLLGATPIFVDIDKDTFNLNPEHLGRAIEAVKKQDASIYPLPIAALQKSLRPRAIIPVDLFGQAANYAKILTIAKEHKLLVLEDAAQSFGGSQNDIKTCNLGCHAAATSFFPAKPLGCYGDGGAIFTNDDELAAVLRSIRVHGKGNDKYDNVRIGLNGRLDTLQAAILLAKLQLFAEEISLRQNVASHYAKALQNINNICIPHIETCNVSAWAQYCILLPKNKRESVVNYLKNKNIPTNIYYPKPQHTLTALAKLGYAQADMPIAQHISECILALPFHPYLLENEIQFIAKTLQEALV